jgi:hypothetical protein
VCSTVQRARESSPEREIRSWTGLNLRFFDPGLLLGNQALHKLRPFLLVGLHTLRQEQFANLRNAPRLAVGDFLNLILQIR